MKIRQLIPMLESDNVPETIRFYTEQLGFKVFKIAENETGVFWCSLYRDNAEIMFTDRNAHSKEKKATFNGVLYFYPEDVMELWDELKTQAKVEWEPQDFGYGMLDFAIRDNNDFILAFGKSIEA